MSKKRGQKPNYVKDLSGVVVEGLCYWQGKRKRKTNQGIKEYQKAYHYHDYYDNDGRKQSWNGNVWMNPPYSQPLIAEFIQLLIEKFNSSEVKQACVLVNNATETNFYQDMLEVCAAVCFVKGRIKFIDIEGKSTGAPLQGQSILYFGANVEKFFDNFLQYGSVLYAKRQR